MMTAFKEFTKTDGTIVSVNTQKINTFYTYLTTEGRTLLDLGGDDYLIITETYEQVKKILSDNQINQTK